MASEPEFDAVLTGLRAGDNAAATLLFEKFASQLLHVTRQNLNGQIRRKLDPDDVVQSVFRTFFRRTAVGEFSLCDWDDLWGLLATIAVRKCSRQLEFYSAARRDCRREVPLDEMMASHDVDLLAKTPAPLETAAFTETLELLMHDLNKLGKQVLVLRLHGYSVEEISEQVGRTQRTVFRTLELIKARLRSWCSDAS